MDCSELADSFAIAGPLDARGGQANAEMPAETWRRLHERSRSRNAAQGTPSPRQARGPVHAVAREAAFAAGQLLDSTVRFALFRGPSQRSPDRRQFPAPTQAARDGLHRRAPSCYTSGVFGGSGRRNAANSQRFHRDPGPPATRRASHGISSVLPQVHSAFRPLPGGVAHACHTSMSHRCAQFAGRPGGPHAARAAPAAPRRHLVLAPPPARSQPEPLLGHLASQRAGTTRTTTACRRPCHWPPPSSAT